MRTRNLAIILLTAVLFATASLSYAQPGQMKDAIEQLAVDMHVGLSRSTLNEQQKAQFLDDFRELREAHQNHQMFAAMRAARSIRTELNSGAFQPEDRQRIQQDLQQIKEAREDRT